MPALNRIQLIGHLGKEPETHFTTNGKNVAHFSIGVSRRWKSSDGEKHESTDWFNIEAWGRLGEICQQYLHKGSLIYLEGSLRTDRYEQGGEFRYFTKVIASALQMLDRRHEQDEEALAEEEEEPVAE